MKITATNVYVGPSIYANFPVIRMVLDIGILVDWPSVKCGKKFTDGLQKALPSLAEHGCSYREPGGFIRRLTENDDPPVLVLDEGNGARQILGGDDLPVRSVVVGIVDDVG